MISFQFTRINSCFFLTSGKSRYRTFSRFTSVIQDSFDRAGFDLAIDYNREPVPPIQETDIIWVNELLKAHGLR